MVNIVCVRITPEFGMESQQPLFTCNCSNIAFVQAVSGYAETEPGRSDVKTNNKESEGRQGRKRRKKRPKPLR